MADNLKKIDILSNLLYAFFRMQIFMSNIKTVNYPSLPQCIFSIWHANQLAFYGLKDLERLNVLISSSNALSAIFISFHQTTLSVF